MARQDDRKAARVPVEIPVTIVGVGGVTTLAGRRATAALFDTHDLSLGGAFLRATSLLEVGETVELEFALHGGHVVRTTARVIRVQTAPPSGMGVTFDDMRDADRLALRMHLASRH